MKTILSNWKKIIVIALACWGVSIGLHRLMPVNLAAHLPTSVIVQNNLLLPVAGTALLLNFIILAAIFVSFQDRLPGTKLMKGVWYGLLVSGTWLVAFVEPVAIMNSTLPAEVYNWLPDGPAIVLMGICLGLFAATDGAPIIGKDVRRRVLPALIVAASLLAGRYFAYSVLDINTLFDLQPWPVLAWTVTLSLAIGAKYLVLGQGVPDGQYWRRAIWFGGLIFGLDWLIGNLFFLIFFQIPILNPIARAASDIVFVSLGVLLAEMALASTYRANSEILKQV